jgi:hypothetical protein
MLALIAGLVNYFTFDGIVSHQIMKLKRGNIMTNQLGDIMHVVGDAFDDALKKRGAANIIIAGKTGVGKSTLIDAVFQGKMADTGQGKPVTQCTKRITKKDIPISIYDTKGLEVKEYKPILHNLMNFIESNNSTNDASHHIHVAWLCIAEGARRVEENSQKPEAITAALERRAVG